MSAVRQASGGLLIDRNRPLSFTFDGRRFSGFAGDTLASALLASDVHLFGRSFKYHRPRGVMTLGSDEPCALVELGEDGAREPNTRATQVELHDGLVASSQNRWPSLGADVFSVLDRFPSLLPAGFYYKTFMAPKGMWPLYERFIRRMAGLGRAAEHIDPARYEKSFAHCDVLVIGGGAAGLSAALAAGHAGARVILADDQPRMGLGLLGREGSIDGGQPFDWARRSEEELAAMPNVRLLRRSTVTGCYEDNLLTIVQQVQPDVLFGQAPQARQRLWKVRARQVVLAAGAFERPLLFANNDRPGIMLSSAVVGYLDRYGVAVGQKAVVATSHDGGYLDACRLADRGLGVAAVADTRASAPDWAAAMLKKRGIEALRGWAVVDADGGRDGLRALWVQDRETGKRRRLPCDVAALSGGWTPSVHLYAHTRTPLAFDDRLQAFLPGEDLPGFRTAGACRGNFGLAAAVSDGQAAGTAAAAACGHTRRPPPLRAEDGHPCGVPAPASVCGTAKEKRAFVDFQNDVTAGDIRLAVREGYEAPEHLKRYTTLGMGTDQGKLGNLNGLAVLAHARGMPLGGLGPTTFRPPFVPTTLGALIGADGGDHAHPLRRTAAHRLHEEAGATWLNAGLWKRPQFYRRAGESDLDAVNREVRTVRSGVGIVDVSTLGKLDIQGPDALDLVERVYMNGFRTLKAGKGRYGVMLREDGMIFDDGVTMRLAENHFLMSTTTGQVQAVYEHMTRLLETEWQQLDAFVTDVTENWFACALVGPAARAVLERLAPDTDLTPETLPFMACTQGTVAGIPARIFRISFSGELSFEINVPSDYGPALWSALLDAGRPEGLIHYGVESMGVMRIEKGYFVVGREADGRTTPDDLGLGRMASRKKNYIGRPALDVPAYTEDGRRQLVGVVTADQEERIPLGAHLVAPPEAGGAGLSLGYVTSQAFSPTLGRHVALALLENGRSRKGERLYAASPTAGRRVAVEVTEPVFVDPEGKRLHG
ncbi:sarcosine oxidase subunit alpha family protein [Pelagibius sp. CAU 1746]|uniref:sarcosine oxidase subunit alpha family protein n=1 Tax=Pelagibius sp. CAU 1746 TaxID=3140370 RepID=UPI00325ABC0D